MKFSSRVLKEWKEDRATREGFGEGLVRAASRNKKIVALTADLAGSTNLSLFKKKFPSRFYDVGVAEQCMAGVSAGMASEGLLPVITSFAVFSPGRDWDFIRAQIMLTNLPVVIVGSHAGLATGEDGATHQALEDVALMRSFHNCVVLSPCDYREAAVLTEKAFSLRKPVYLRLARAKMPVIFKSGTNFSVGKSVELCKGKHASILCSGVMASHCLEAARMLLEKKISVSVIQHSTLRPLDKKGVPSGVVFTVEDHSVVGGLGSAVAEVIAERGRGKLVRIGVDSFGESGSVKELYKKYGLDASSIARVVRSRV